MSEGQAGAHFEITPAMMEAKDAVLSRFWAGGGPDEMSTDAMESLFEVASVD